MRNQKYISRKEQEVRSTLETNKNELLSVTAQVIYEAYTLPQILFVFEMLLDSSSFLLLQTDLTIRLDQLQKYIIIPYEGRSLHAFTVLSCCIMDGIILHRGGSTVSIYSSCVQDAIL